MRGLPVYSLAEFAEVVKGEGQGLKKVPTGEEELHGKVAASLSDGYSYNGRTLSPEKVAVYTYEKPVQETEKSEKSEGMNNG